MSCWDLLPVQEPRLHKESPEYFYKNILKPLIKDIIRIQANGIHLDTKKAEELKNKLDSILKKVDKTLEKNKLVIEFQKVRSNKIYNKYKEELESKKKTYKDFLKSYKATNSNHRNALVNYLLGTPITNKWTIKKIKEELPNNSSLQLALDKTLSDSHPEAEAAMRFMAEEKAKLINIGYDHKINNPPKDLLDKFNPGSSKQKTEFFEWLGIKSEAISKTTGAPTWDKEQIIRVNQEAKTNDLKKVTEAMITFSQAAIIRSNFINAFDKFVIDNRLYGNFKLFGTKTMRLTSNSPNLLNMPSTGSVFAKPIKECFTAPKGKVILTADFNALEDRVLASITKDPGKVAIQIDPDLDGHCYNALGYFRKPIEKIIGAEGSHEEKTKRFNKLIHEGNKELKNLRQESKKISFGISYGSYPPKIASSVGCSLEEAERIFNSYHNDLYPEVTNYRENYVLTTAKKDKKIHLGLGCYINTSNPKKEIRTINNATIQFWSILTLLSINKMHELIDKEGLQNDVKCIATIYDSIYYEVTEDPKIIKWVNDNLIPIMCKDFLVNQIVPNTAESEIGYSWAELKEIPHNASEKQIQETLNSLNS